MRDGWRQVTLGEIAQVNPEATKGWSASRAIRYVDISTVQWGKRLAPTMSPIPYGDAPGRARRVIRSDDVVVSTVRPNLRAMAVVPESLDGEVASTGFAVLRARPGKTIPGFVWSLVSHMPFTEDMMAKATGSNYPAIRSADVSSYKILLPPLRVQERIVDLIDTLDTTIQSAEAEAAALEVVTAKLRERHPDAPHVPVGDILNAIDSGVSTKPVDGDGVEQRMLTLAALRPGRFHPAGIKSVGAAGLPRKVRVVDGDLFITRSNTPDRVGYVAIAREVGPETYFPDLVWRLRPIRERVSPVYLEQLLSSITFRARITALATGTSNSMRKINKANFSSLRIPVPTLTEQDDYARPILHAVQAERSAQTLLAHLRSLRLNLLTVLLSGEHEIPESYDELMEVAS